MRRRIEALIAEIESEYGYSHEAMAIVRRLRECLKAEDSENGGA